MGEQRTRQLSLEGLPANAAKAGIVMNGARQTNICVVFEITIQLTLGWLLHTSMVLRHHRQDPNRFGMLDYYATGTA